jgi:hypothetical protein
MEPIEEMMVNGEVNEFSRKNREKIEPNQSYHKVEVDDDVNFEKWLKNDR